MTQVVCLRFLAQCGDRVPKLCQHIDRQAADAAGCTRDDDGPVFRPQAVSSMRTIAAKAAVKPAVPTAMASNSERPFGKGTTQSAGTRVKPGVATADSYTDIEAGRDHRTLGL